MAQAGGVATDGKMDILDVSVADIGQRSPVYIGSRFEVEKAKEYLEKALR